MAFCFWFLHTRAFAGTVAAYYTKPDRASFDGRPAREMMRFQDEAKKQIKEAQGIRPKAGLDGLIGTPKLLVHSLDANSLG